MFLKSQIQQEYSEIILQNAFSSVMQKEYICKPIFDPIAQKYTQFEGYIEEADLGFGCGFPFEFIDFEEGLKIADLGCAAGIDSFIMAKRGGIVSGIDITQSLIDRANEVKKHYKIPNVEFNQGDIERLPFDDNSMDYATSNGVFSLLPDLNKAFSEVFRILNNTGVFILADISKKAKIPNDEYSIIKKYTGCLNGIRLQSKYAEIAKSIGFNNIEIVSERKLNIPVEIVSPEHSVFYITIYKMTK